MASRNVKLKIETQLQKKALDDAVKGIRNVDKAMEKSGKTSVKMADAGVKANKRNSHAAGQAALQLQDVAVQAQMGTDSMRILGQQGPQLLSAFGPKGMLLGLAVAVGAGLVSAFRKPKEEIGDLIEEIERLESIGKSIADINVDRLENSISEAALRSEEARQAFQRMMDTRIQSERTALSATHALIEAEIKRNELRGDSVEGMKSALNLEKALSKNEEDANSRANKRVASLQDEIRGQEELINKRKVISEQIIAQNLELDKQREIQKELLAEQAKTQAAAGKFLGSDIRITPTTGQEKAAREAFLAAQEGATKLDDIEKELLALTERQEGLRLQIIQAANAVKESKETIDADLQKIQLEKKAADVLAAQQNMGDNLGSLAGVLNEAADAFGAEAPSGIAAKIKGLLEDGIQTNELAELSMATTQLTNRVNQSFGEQQKTMRDVIGELQILSNKSAEFDAKIDALKAQNRTPRATR